MPSSAVRWNSPSSREAPSSMEYSVCTCRCTKLSAELVEEPDDMEETSAPFGVADGVTGGAEVLTAQRAPEGGGRTVSLRQCARPHRQDTRPDPRRGGRRAHSQSIAWPWPWLYATGVPSSAVTNRAEGTSR